MRHAGIENLSARARKTLDALERFRPSTQPPEPPENRKRDIRDHGTFKAEMSRPAGY